jgi:hypothetical protein
MQWMVEVLEKEGGEHGCEGLFSRGVNMQDVDCASNTPLPEASIVHQRNDKSCTTKL